MLFEVYSDGAEARQGSRDPGRGEAEEDEDEEEETDLIARDREAMMHDIQKTI